MSQGPQQVGRLRPPVDPRVAPHGRESPTLLDPLLGRTPGRPSCLDDLLLVGPAELVDFDALPLAHAERTLHPAMQVSGHRAARVGDTTGDQLPKPAGEPGRAGRTCSVGSRQQPDPLRDRMVQIGFDRRQRGLCGSGLRRVQVRAEVADGLAEPAACSRRQHGSRHQLHPLIREFSGQLRARISARVEGHGDRAPPCVQRHCLAHADPRRRAQRCCRSRRRKASSVLTSAGHPVPPGSTDDGRWRCTRPHRPRPSSGMRRRPPASDP